MLTGRRNDASLLFSSLTFANQTNWGQKLFFVSLGWLLQWIIFSQFQRFSTKSSENRKCSCFACMQPLAESSVRGPPLTTHASHLGNLLPGSLQPGLSGLYIFLQRLCCSFHTVSLHCEGGAFVTYGIWSPQTVITVGDYTNLHGFTKLKQPHIISWVKVRVLNDRLNFTGCLSLNQKWSFK